jgi:uncharacterized protein YceH (UPF0502 family)
MRLSPIAARVLGALVEKRLTTPAQYPLSIAALQTACNQRSAREPVMDISEGQVQTALAELRSDSLCRTSPVRGRVHKHEHLLERQLDLDEAAQTVLGVLLLRGSQTVGEIRTRTERWHDFPSLEAVEAVLTRLADHPFVTLVAELPREPGRREARWTDLITDHAPDLTPGRTPGPDDNVISPPSDGRVVVRETTPPIPTAGQLTQRVDALEAEMAELKTQLAALTDQLSPLLDGDV